MNIFKSRYIHVAEFRGHYSLESIPLPVLVVVGVVQLMKREVLGLSWACHFIVTVVYYVQYRVQTFNL